MCKKSKFPLVFNIFLAFFIFIAWRLNAAFWKDVK